ncbi:MAG: hypothetical protein H0X25_20780 [Acidobacteriales bacterium]|nr:hypothetical protein [Terriglobales bacterium]
MFREDPNLAFIGAWPSTTLWRRTIALAAKISPQEAEKVLAAIPDPNIVALETVTYANVLLGVAPHPISVTDIRKNGAKGMMMLMP